MTPEGGTGPGPGMSLWTQPGASSVAPEASRRTTGFGPVSRRRRYPRGEVDRMPKALVTTASARAALEPHPAGRTTMPRLRSDGPCFWATWLTRMLSGEDSCDWAACSGPTTRTAVGGKCPATSTGLVGRWPTPPPSSPPGRAGRPGPHCVHREQNCFALKGASGNLGGRPDLIARRQESRVIIDVRTGKDHPPAFR